MALGTPAHDVLVLLLQLRSDRPALAIADGFAVQFPDWSDVGCSSGKKCFLALEQIIPDQPVFTDFQVGFLLQAR